MSWNEEAQARDGPRDPAAWQGRPLRVSRLGIWYCASGSAGGRGPDNAASRSAAHALLQDVSQATEPWGLYPVPRREPAASPWGPHPGPGPSAQPPTPLHTLPGSPLAGTLRTPPRDRSTTSHHPLPRPSPAGQGRPTLTGFRKGRRIWRRSTWKKLPGVEQLTTTQLQSYSWLMSKLASSRFCGSRERPEAGGLSPCLGAALGTPPGAHAPGSLSPSIPPLLRRPGPHPHPVLPWASWICYRNRSLATMPVSRLHRHQPRAAQAPSSKASA